MGIILSFALIFLQGNSKSTFEVVTDGMACKQSPDPNSGMNCSYRIGRDLEIDMAGIGREDASITVTRTRGYDGDYYATFGILHGCIVIKPNLRTARTEKEFLARADNMAFISPATGHVYKTWRECGETNIVRSPLIP